MGAHLALQAEQRLPSWIVDLDRHPHARRQSADVHPPCGAGAGWKRLTPGQPLLEALGLGEFLGTEELEQPEETVRVILQGCRGQEEDVAAPTRDRRDRPVGLVAGVSPRPSQVVGLVHDQEIDPGLDRLLGEPAPGSKQVEPDDRARVDLERVEIRPMVAGHVGEPLLVKKGKDLVVLAPELAQPLKSQGLGRDDQGAVGAAGLEEAIEDQAGLDGLAQPDLIRQQPAHRIAVAGALGGVELVGEELDASAEEGAQSAGLAEPLEPKPIQPVDEVVVAVHLPPRQAFSKRKVDGQWPEVGDRDLPAVLQLTGSSLAGRDHHRLAGQARLRPRQEGERDESVRARGEGEGLAAVGESHLDLAIADLDHLAGSQLGIESVRQAVAGLPHRGGLYPPAVRDTSSMVTFLCPVRACAAPLERRDHSWACPRGHSFDIARSGYCNLLQPQDRKSKSPGDPKEAVLARRRFLEAGHGDFLLQALLEEIGTPSAILDVGCGEGFFLGSLVREREMEAHGVDLSVPAIDLAARRWPEVSWWVVNADRALPFADGSFDLALSIAGRRPSKELRRVLHGAPACP